MSPRRLSNPQNVSPTTSSVPFRFTRGEESPLLVVGQHGRGRVAALATDVAPHWVGGLVDWGDRRITQEVAGGFVEIGNWYAQFFRNLTGLDRKALTCFTATQSSDKAADLPA